MNISFSWLAPSVVSFDFNLRRKINREKTSRQLRIYLYIFPFSSFEGVLLKTTKFIWHLSIGCLAMAGFFSLLLNIGYFEQCSLFRFMKDCILSLEIPTKYSLIRLKFFKRIFSFVFMIEVAHYIVNLGCHSYYSFIFISNINLKLIKLDYSYINASEIFPRKFLNAVFFELLSWNLCTLRKGVE